MSRTNYNKMSNKTYTKTDNVSSVNDSKNVEVVSDSVVEDSIDEELNVEAVSDSVVEDSIDEELNVSDPTIEEQKTQRFGIVERLLNLRKEKSVDSNVIAVMPKNTKVEIFNEDDSWFEVVYDENRGYCLKQFIVL